MATSQNKDLLMHLEMTIRRMRVTDIPEIIAEIPGIDWTKLKLQIRNNKLHFTSKDIAKIVIKHIKNMNRITSEDLTNLIALADLITLSKYSFRKSWYTFTISSNEDLVRADIQQLVVSIKSALLKKYKSDFIHTYYHLYDGIAWIRIIKYKANSFKPGLVTYLAFVLSDNYIFCNRQKPELLILEGLTNGLNCTNIKSRKLHGRIIKSLIDILRNKNNNANNIRQIQKQFDWSESIYKSTPSGLSFLQDEKRKEYTDYIFGQTPPIVETVVLKTKGATWSQNCGYEQLAGKNFGFELKIDAKKVNESLKESIVEKIIKTPAPAWCTELLTAGKNIVSVEEE